LDGRSQGGERCSCIITVSSPPSLKRAIEARLAAEATRDPEITLAAWARRAFRRELARPVTAPR